MWTLQGLAFDYFIKYLHHLTKYNVQLVGPIFKQVAEDFPSDKVKFVKVDTDVHEDTVAKYNIQGLPLFGLFINGEIVVSHSGALNRDALKDFVNKGLTDSHIL